MKKALGPVNALYPSLTTIVGAVVDGRPNFLAVAHVGIMNHGTPQYISIGLNKKHYTPQGIRQHGQFSVNIPSRYLMVETDYVGLVSGRNTDKSEVFEVFYGDLPQAPMIAQCPVTMECRLHSTIDFASHDIFIGEIVATHAEPEVLGEGGCIDVVKVAPLLFDMGSRSYYDLGSPLGGCWSVGKVMKRERE
jgi:flavin reductase (DIM6/NTAB) family NADH-FMN oxidoreductase RutF